VSAEADVAALKATIRAQGIEIRDLKSALATASNNQTQAVGEVVDKLDTLTMQLQPLLLAGPKLQQLLDEAERQKGMAQLGKVLAGGSAFTILGAAATGIYNYFVGGGAQ
jgi:hypothetical protein